MPVDFECLTASRQQPWGGASGRFDRGSGYLGKGTARADPSGKKKQLQHVAHAKLGWWPISSEDPGKPFWESVRVSLEIFINLLISGVKVYKQQRNPPIWELRRGKIRILRRRLATVFWETLMGGQQKTERSLYSGGRCGWDVADACFFFWKVEMKRVLPLNHFHSIDFHWSISLV